MAPALPACCLLSRGRPSGRGMHAERSDARPLPWPYRERTEGPCGTGNKPGARDRGTTNGAVRHEAPVPAKGVPPLPLPLLRSWLQWRGPRLVAKRPTTRKPWPYPPGNGQWRSCLGPVRGPAGPWGPRQDSVRQQAMPWGRWEAPACRSCWRDTRELTML